MSDADYIVIGAGSAGCVVAARLKELGVGSVLVLEAGPSERHPLVAMPFGLVWLMGSKLRDWRFKSTPQGGLGGREIPIPRGRMVGGSGSINSMVWFRGCRSDFDGWDVEGWRWADVEPVFEAVEARLKPRQLATAHAVTKALARVFPNNADAPPTPERETAGVFEFNLHNGKRHSAADAFLRPAGVAVRTGADVDRIGFKNGHAVQVHLVSGEVLRVAKGIVLSAGSIGSPAILMRSGIGPAADLEALGIDVVMDAPEVGQNLQDHPSVGLYYEGAGYGITWSQLAAWVVAPLNYLLRRKGRLASPTVEGGMFFNATGADSVPDVQSHFIPFKLGHKGRRYVWGKGFFADVCVCRPKSRGGLRLVSKDPCVAPAIDLGILADKRDEDLLVAGLKRLRVFMTKMKTGAREVFPGVEADLRDHVRTRCATAYHPVGTLAMGGPVDAKLRVKGVTGLWVADASVMPKLTSANTNAPSMMIGYKAANLIVAA